MPGRSRRRARVDADANANANANGDGKADGDRKKDKKDSAPSAERFRLELQALLKGWDWRATIPLLAVIGIVAIVFYILQFPRHEAWSVLGTAIVTASAASFAGALVGLLFGIPRLAGRAADQASSGSADPRYQGNDNLVQISDWLTKILVGAGLVQLGRLPKALAELGSALHSGFGGKSSSAGFGLAVVIFYVVSGFLYLYLWSRLSLPKRLEAAERAVTQLTVQVPKAMVGLASGVSTSGPKGTQPSGPEVDIAGQRLSTRRAWISSPPLGVASLLSTAIPDIQSSSALAADLPNPSLAEVGVDIQRELRRLLAATGHVDAVGGSSLEMVQTLEAAADLKTGALDAIRQFSTAQSLLAQQGSSVDPDLVRSATDSGLLILQALRSAPRERHFVLHVDIDLFDDANCETRLAGVQGIILHTVLPTGESQPRIFPTTRRDLQVGQEVSWEWDSSSRVGPAWYRDPDDQQIRKGWDASSIFLGRDLALF